MKTKRLPRTMPLIAALLVFVIATIGIAVIPTILLFTYSWCWVPLYTGTWLLVAVSLLYINYWIKENNL